jgi:DNA-binding NtrC family response regulator
MNAAVVPTTHSSPIPIHPVAIEGRVSLHLLVVDNDRFVRETCKEAAAALGYHTTATGTAEQALWLMDSQSIDVVLLDMNLPGAGGLEVLRQIKGRQPDIEVIVMTGNDTMQSAVQAMKAGAYDLVTKPFGLNELKLLLERVASHLALKVENRRQCDEMKSRAGLWQYHRSRARDGQALPDHR